MAAGQTHRRISIGPLIGLVGALLLLVSLFLDWWDEVTAFTGFEVLDLVLAGLALAAILSLAEAAGARLPSATAIGSALALPLGLLALLIVASQLVNDPPAVAGGERGHATGIWLALAGALLMVGGSLLSVARISLALDLDRRERAGEADPVRDPAREPEAATPPPPASEAPTRAEPERPI
jgi:hypothetical protein